jgi:hypothetical protein
VSWAKADGVNPAALKRAAAKQKNGARMFLPPLYRPSTGWTDDWEATRRPVGFSEIGINFDKIRRFGYHSSIRNRPVKAAGEERY